MRKPVNLRAQDFGVRFAERWFGIFTQGTLENLAAVIWKRGYYAGRKDNNNNNNNKTSATRRRRCAKKLQKIGVATEHQR